MSVYRLAGFLLFFIIVLLFGCGQGSGSKEQVILDAEQSARYQEYQKRFQQMQEQTAQQLRGQNQQETSAPDSQKPGQ